MGNRDNLLARKLLPDIIPDIPGRGFIFQQDGELVHPAQDTVAFLEQKFTPDFIHSSSCLLWPPNTSDLNPVDNSIWSAL